MSGDLVQRAEALFRRGDLEQADAILVELLAQSPNSPQGVLLTGLVAARRCDFKEAVSWLNRALELSPNDYIGLLWLPVALRGDGKHYEAIRVGERARKLWPDSPEVLSGLALDYFNVKDYTRSEECLRLAIKQQPRNPSFQRKLGSLYEAVGRDADAAIAYQAVIDIAPSSEEGYCFLGRLLIGHGNFTQALERCERALKVLPNSAQIHLIYAQALRGVREFAPADEQLKIAISLDPNIVLAAALWLNEDGRFAEAEELFRRSIEIRPAQGVAYFGLIKGKKTTLADADLVEKMKSLLGDPSLSQKELAALRYGLGKAADDMGHYEEAMVHFEAANDLKYRIYLEGKGFDYEESVSHREKTIAMFTPEFMAENRSLGSDSNVPIFVIGMIRSGTTLVEQIIASHPDVGGAGEQRFWVSELSGVLDVDKKALNAAKFVELRERYLQVLRSLQPVALRITDKMPMNFYCAGILHLAFPHSPIIHIRRNPVDTALSIYMTDLARPPEFAHNKRNIVLAYREYQEMMTFWRTVIPENRMLDLSYEDLIADQEHWTRRIIDFCGLSWDPVCLEFYKSDRQVTTPSMWQVRQPIYRTSVEKWRNYEPWLGEFAELLPG